MSLTLNPKQTQNPKPKTQNRIVFLVGPTAVGKSETAGYLAQKLDAEIISCDSMQVYKGMDIVTSKPSLVLREKIPHYLINIVSPTREYNVFRYRKAAIKKLKEIINKGKAPLFVGGTGLYMSILLDGIFKLRAKDNAIRRQLYREVESQGGHYLYQRLKEVDAQAALRIHPHDTKRIIRALEVFRTSGKPISELQKQRQGLRGEYDLKIFCLNMERSSLYQRIEERVEEMFAQGLLSEVKEILKSRLSKTAASCIGIKEIKGYLDGRYDLPEAKQLMKRNTRLYAKRQLTWFRKDRRIKWIEVGDKERAEEVAKRIWRELY